MRTKVKDVVLDAINTKFGKLRDILDKRQKHLIEMV